MKNAIKSFCLAAAITISIGACSGNKKGGSADSTKIDSSVSTSVKTDSSIKTDSAKKDTNTLTADTPKMKIDTTSKTITKKTVVKKVVLKKP